MTDRPMPFLRPFAAAPRRQSFLAALLLVAVLALVACQAEKQDTGSEGTTALPITLTLGVALNGTVGKAPANSYYTVTGLTSSTTYTFSLSNLNDDADLIVFKDAGFSTIFCESSHNGTASETCPATTDSGGANSQVWIQVKSFSATGTTYLISVN